MQARGCLQRSAAWGGLRRPHRCSQQKAEALQWQHRLAQRAQRRQQQAVLQGGAQSAQAAGVFEKAMAATCHRLSRLKSGPRHLGGCSAGRRACPPHLRDLEGALGEADDARRKRRLGCQAIAVQGNDGRFVGVAVRAEVAQGGKELAQQVERAQVAAVLTVRQHAVRRAAAQHRHTQPAQELRQGAGSTQGAGSVAGHVTHCGHLQGAATRAQQQRSGSPQDQAQRLLRRVPQRGGGGQAPAGATEEADAQQSRHAMQLLLHRQQHAAAARLNLPACQHASHTAPGSMPTSRARAPPGHGQVEPPVGVRLHVTLLRRILQQARAAPQRSPRLRELPLCRVQAGSLLWPPWARRTPSQRKPGQLRRLPAP